MKKIIAVDGPAGAGKSTVSKLVAEKLGFVYIDTGAMYRAVAFKILTLNQFITEKLVEDTVRDIDIDLKFIDGTTKVFVDGGEVTDAIRTPEVTQIVSTVAKIRLVREKLVEMQRKMAERGGVIMDGRDIGTNVLPDADVKIFLTASLEERAKRRYDEITGRGFDADLAEVEKDLAERDKQDSERAIDPLIKADDAVLIDTTGKKINEVVDEILALCK